MKFGLTILSVLLLATPYLSIAAKDAKVTKTVAFTISVDGVDLNSEVHLGLFGDNVPKTAENFYQLCIGDQISKSSGKALAFVGSGFHRIIPNFMIQGGDFTNHNGTGGE